MPSVALRVGILAALLAAALLTSGGARAALIAYEDVVLRADGGFEPRQLPRRGFEPISFHGFVDIARKGGGRPEPLLRAVIDFDRDGRLDVRGLAGCPPKRVAQLGTRAARVACRGALVGTGRVEAAIELGGGGVPTSSPLSIFNGPRRGGLPTAILHARIALPAPEVHAITVPIRSRRGAFRHRAIIAMPPLAGGLGALTRIEVEIGRRFVAGGQPRSYVSARCSDGVVETDGRFEFADGLVIDGGVERPCTPT